jgi:uncharacterized damage-inducible protein DinB
MNFEKRPRPGDYDPYYQGYVDRVPSGDIVMTLAVTWTETKALLRELDEATTLFRYEPGKWSIKEILVHLMDAERIFVNRALRFARGDETELPGFDEQAYSPLSGADARPAAEIIEEFQWMRGAHLRFWRGLPPQAWDRTGVANGSRVKVGALPWIIAGHEIHHRGVIEKRYL